MNESRKSIVFFLLLGAFEEIVVGLTEFECQLVGDGVSLWGFGLDFVDEVLDLVVLALGGLLGGLD